MPGARDRRRPGGPPGGHAPAQRGCRRHHRLRTAGRPPTGPPACCRPPASSSPNRWKPPHPGSTPPPRASGPARGAHRTRRRRHRVRPWLILAVAVVLALSGLLAAQRINRPLASPRLVSALPASLTVPGVAPALPWPTVGQGAVSVPALGYAAQSGTPGTGPHRLADQDGQRRGHPARPSPGPRSGGAPRSPSPSPTWPSTTTTSTTTSRTSPIQLGEKLTEFQMLEALMNQSANDIAYSLAMWDAEASPPSWPR